MKVYLLFINGVFDSLYENVQDKDTFYDSLLVNTGGTPETIALKEYNKEEFNNFISSLNGSEELSYEVDSMKIYRVESQEIEESSPINWIAVDEEMCADYWEEPELSVILNNKILYAQDPEHPDIVEVSEKTFTYTVEKDSFVLDRELHPLS